MVNKHATDDAARFPCQSAAARVLQREIPLPSVWRFQSKALIYKIIEWLLGGEGWVFPAVREIRSSRG
jgi:hypothetical protein